MTTTAIATATATAIATATATAMAMAPAPATATACYGRPGEAPPATSSTWFWTAAAERPLQGPVGERGSAPKGVVC